MRRQLLKDGDVVVIGQHMLTYIDERPSTPRAPKGAAADLRAARGLCVIRATIL